MDVHPLSATKSVMKVPSEEASLTIITAPFLYTRHDNLIIPARRPFLIPLPRFELPTIRGGGTF